MSVVLEKLSVIGINSPVVLTYTGLSFTILILNYLTLGKSNKLFFTVYRSTPFSPLTYIRLFGHVLGHKGFNHFFNNFLLILLVGPMLEEKYGSLLLLSIITATAFVTGTIFIVFSKNRFLCGASGEAFMLILLSSYVNFKNNLIPLTLILVAAAYTGREVYQGVTSKDKVSHLTHIVGGLCGAVLGFYINTYGISAVSRVINEIYENLISR